MAKTWVELSAAKLLHNLESFYRLRQRPLMVAVKGNAYGHGLCEVVSIIKDSPHVALVMPSRADLDRCRAAAAETGRILRVHLKVETGTVRLGMSVSEAVSLLTGGLDDHPGIRIVGVYSHFANIEDTTDHRFARSQLARFEEVLDALAPQVRSKLTVHFSCSASALVFPESLFDLVRLGISAYGYWPSKPVIVSFNQAFPGNEFSLKPVLGWYSRVAQVKELPAGTPVGYGLSYKTLTSSRLAVIPVGYYDGYDRQLSNQGLVLIRGQAAPIRGRICMNMFMVDVGHIPGVRAGDRVTLLGEEGDNQLDAGTLADWSGTIHYEVLARINPLLPRVVV
jgi:alanine racemase